MAVPVSLTLPQFSPRVDLALEAVDAAAELGYSGVFCFDHLVPLDAVTRPVLEAAALVGTVAARSRVRVGTLVLRAPLRGPGISAAVAASAAMVARAGFVLGLGAGDALSREEAERFGQPQGSLSERVGAVAETIRRVRSDGTPSSIWVGGRHPRMLELAAGEADGWNGWALEPGDLAEVCSGLRAQRPDLTLTWGGGVVVGRDADDLARCLEARGGDDGVIAATTSELASELSRRVAAGVDELVVSVLPNRPERWELFAREVLPALA